MSPIELEEYELAIEEQAYPFEERAIEVHQSNLELLSLDVYNQWIEKSLQKLARFIRGAIFKTEEESEIIVSLDSYRYEIEMPVTVSDPEQQPGSEEMEPDSDNRLKTPATTLNRKATQLKIQVKMNLSILLLLTLFLSACVDKVTIVPEPEIETVSVSENPVVTQLEDGRRDLLSPK
ncbi:hypothetical protein [uncultured Desulfuromusa sp.]|uniref:hypothetical protein n=1 Tax=uncultured Desulfuromusa sp. TaxID=219183 RepID=UPI002AA80251|nr:hypothetical protein [uncultured Desulfuromusa sp.]